MKIVRSHLAIALMALCLHNVSAQDSTAFAGTVVSVSDTSITVKTAQGDKTLAIDSSTHLWI